MHHARVLPALSSTARREEPAVRLAAAFGRFALGVAFGAALLPSQASAQGVGFHAGDIWESNDAVHVLSTSGGSLQKIDVLTGGVTPKIGSMNQAGFGGLAYDTYRQRLIWRASIDSPSFQHIWQVDGNGNYADMGFPVSGYSWFAPTGDGRIYCHDSQTQNKLAWFDAANRAHILLDQAGTAPFTFGQGPIATLRGCVYDAPTNALFFASYLDCSGTPSLKIVIGKLPLSADGTRVAGPLTCNSFDTTSGFVEFPSALTHLPDGRLLMVCPSPAQSPAVPLPQLLAVNPFTLAMSPFAQVGDNLSGANYTLDDGVWSHVLGQAVVLDTFGNTLRTFSEGSVGNGGVITPVGGAFAIPSAEAEQIVEIPDTACDGAWVPYGTGLAGAGGAVPGLFGGGCAQPGATVTLHVDQLVGGASGALFLGLTSAAAPFKGGTFRVGTIFLSLGLAAGGAAGVPGAGTLAIPAVLPGNPALTGLSIFLQGAFSDPAAVKGIALTQGLQMTIG